MSREILPYAAPDVSSLARSLGRELAARAVAPGHVELLNMLARGAGYRNFQHFRAQFGALDRLSRPAPAPEPIDLVRVERAARLFDGDGLLERWPSKAGLRPLCLWVIWSRVPTGRVYREADFNQLMNAEHRFGDHALLRRALCDEGLVVRDQIGSAYRRVELRPPAEAVALIRTLEPRRSGRTADAPSRRGATAG